VQIALNEEGIEFSTADSNGMIRWEKFLKWRQNDNYLLVYLMPRMYYIIPKSIEASGFDLAALTSTRPPAGALFTTAVAAQCREQEVSGVCPFSLLDAE